MPPEPPATILLSRADVRSLVDLDDAILEVERAFALHAGGGFPPPGALGSPASGGWFHVKAAWLPGPDRYAVKTNANFPGNPAARGLPTIQGLLLLFDGDSGAPLAVLDSLEVTILRTAAATAVAARALAQPDASTATVWGCGAQARAQILALARVRSIRRVFLHDRLPARADALAAELAALGFDARAVDDPRAASRASDVVVTCTTSHEPFLGRADVSAGAFVAAVGADAPEKRELHSDLFAGAAVIVDILESCASTGELHHALVEGVLTREAVRAELGEVVAGTKPGRLADDEIAIFDSTGTALQDVALARLAHERALAAGAGTEFSFAR